MTLSTRLTRAGAALLIFGTCAALVPNNGGLVLADTSHDCPPLTPTPHHHSNNTGKTIAYVGGGVVVVTGAIYFFNPTLFAHIFGLGGAGGGGATSTSVTPAAFYPATQLFQFIYDPSSSPTI